MEGPHRREPLVVDDVDGDHLDGVVHAGGRRQVGRGEGRARAGDLLVEDEGGGRRVVAEQDDAIAVPNQALFFEEEKAFVNVKNGSGFEKRPVELGIRSLTRTVVSNGLEEGDKILLGTPPEEEN